MSDPLTLARLKSLQERTGAPNLSELFRMGIRALERETDRKAKP
jgi:hypothetical protein